jgi:hypothetical protein
MDARIVQDGLKLVSKLRFSAALPTPEISGLNGC